MDTVLEKLESRTEYMMQAGARLMNLGNTDISEFKDIGIERFTKLCELLHLVWREGLDLTAFWEH